MDGQTLVAVATFTVAFVAVFQDYIRAFLTRPSLEVITDTASPYCQKILVQHVLNYEITAPGYYLRIAVKNKSRFFKANSVEVFASSLLQKGTMGFVPYEDFDPSDLVWSHDPGDMNPLTNLSPEMEKYCFIGRIIDPGQREAVKRFDRPDLPEGKACLALAPSTERYTKAHIIPPGTYRLYCSVVGSNTKREQICLEMHVSGDWYENEQEMLEKGFSIKII